MKTGRAIRIGAYQSRSKFHSETRDLVAPFWPLASALCAASRSNTKGLLLSQNDSASRTVAQEVNSKTGCLMEKFTSKKPHVH